MTTVPGFSSRSANAQFIQFPQRDEAAMTEPGFSNSPHVPDPASAGFADPGQIKANHLKPGWTNSAAVVVDEPADTKIVEPASVEDKALKPRTTRSAAPKEK